MNKQTKTHGIIIAFGISILAVQCIGFSLLLKKGITIHAHFHVEDASFKDIGILENSNRYNDLLDDKYSLKYTQPLDKDWESDYYYFGGGGYYRPDGVVERFLKPEEMPYMADFDFGENPLKNIDVNGHKLK